MKFKYIYTGLFITLLLLLNSCASSNLYFTSLDVLKPAEVTFPPYIKNIVVVNNAAKQPVSTGHIDINIYDKKTNIEENTDSAAIFATTSLRDEMASVRFFEKVELSTTNQNNTGIFNSTNDLSNLRIKSLCAMYDADAVIALNEIAIADTTQQIKLIEEQFYGYLSVDVKTKWTIYLPDGQKTSVPFRDSFLWEALENDYTVASQRIPKIADAMADACILSGSNTSKRMIPTWEKEDRYFFGSKDKTMKEAMDSVSYHKWNKSIELWKTVFETAKSNKLKYRALHNIAVAYEITGNVNDAINYSKKSLDLYSSDFFNPDKDGHIIVSYYSEIKKRAEEVKLVKQQLGE